MKAQTRIEQAVKAAYDMYADYSRRVDNVPVIPQFPKVRWERGSLKNENTGWWVDGKLYNGSAEEVIEYWVKLRAKWERKLMKALGVTYGAQGKLPGMDSTIEAQQEHGETENLMYGTWNTSESGQ